MKPIRIISPNFDFLGEVDNYESLIFIRRFYKIGEFELRININNDTKHLQEDNIILIGNDGKKAGVIRHREIALDEDGAEILLVRGYTLKGVISRRRIVPPTGQGYDRAEGSTEYIMKHFVKNNFLDSNNSGRKIYQLAIAPNNNKGIEDRWRGSFEVVSDKLEEIGEYSEMGWDVSLDNINKKWIFDVVVGRDLTVNQSTLPPVIFSVDFDNIKGQSYIASAINHANVAYAGGQGEEEDRLIQQIGNATGFERIETFLNCSSAEDITELIEEGNRGLEELKKINIFESQVLNFGSFVYGSDWDLGDIVSVQNIKWNLTMDSRIVEIKEIYEQNGFNLELVFGNTIPSFWNKLKKIEQKQTLGSGGGTGEPGSPGQDGTGLEYQWNGTELGIKREDEVNYMYSDLKGKPGQEGKEGQQGIQGLPGLNGKSLEFLWQGTQLGIRVEGQSEYQYVNLKGDKGERGTQGETGKGLEFTWNGTQLGIRQEGSSNYQYVNLKGDKGDKGNTGATGKSIEFIWSGTQLGVRQEGESAYQYTDLRGLKGEPGKDGYTPIKGVDYFDGEQGEPGATSWNGILDKPGSFPPSNHDHNQLVSIDTRTLATGPTDYSRNFKIQFKSKTAIGLSQANGTYVSLIGFRTWSDDSGGAAIELAYDNAGNIFFRYGMNLGGWKAWEELAKKGESGGGTKIITSGTEPSSLATGDQWHREI